jgi:dTDP-3-amino-2,3,6-trideoxy-4-keto-D-glucose/dTDP-3-amino-3,4,6-trideoxy-alpha-D-glucose/dTDP-2,6-dideoxy-D-kanosamine transaminase
VRLLRHYGQADRYRHERFGVNSRLDEIQAAVLRAKLPLLEGWTERRREIASIYSAALRNGPVEPLVELPGRRLVFHLFVVRAPDRERLRADMSDSGIDTLIHYPLPIHRQPVFAELSGGPVSLWGAEQLGESVLSLPLYPELTEEEINAVATAAAFAAANQPA